MKKAIQRKTDTICSHSYVDPEKPNRRPWGRGREEKREGERQTIRDLKTENKLKVDGGWEGGESG